MHGAPYGAGRQQTVGALMSADEELPSATCCSVASVSNVRRQRNSKRLVAAVSIAVNTGATQTGTAKASHGCGDTSSCLPAAHQTFMDRAPAHSSQFKKYDQHSGPFVFVSFLVLFHICLLKGWL